MDIPMHINRADRRHLIYQWLYDWALVLPGN